MTPALDELFPFPPPWGEGNITGGDDAPTFEDFTQWASDLEANNDEERREMKITDEQVSKFLGKLTEEEREFFRSTFDDDNWEECHAPTMQGHFVRFIEALEDGEFLEGAGVTDADQETVEELKNTLEKLFRDWSRDELHDAMWKASEALAPLQGRELKVETVSPEGATTYRFWDSFPLPEQALVAAVDRFMRSDVETRHNQGLWGGFPQKGEQIEIGKIVLSSTDGEVLAEITVSGIIAGMGHKLISGRSQPVEVNALEVELFQE